MNLTKLAPYRKAAAAALGSAAAVAGAVAIACETVWPAAPWVKVVTAAAAALGAVAGAVGVYRVPNAPLPARPDAPKEA